MGEGTWSTRSEAYRQSTRDTSTCHTTEQVSSAFTPHLLYGLHDCPLRWWVRLPLPTMACYRFLGLQNRVGGRMENCLAVLHRLTMLMSLYWCVERSAPDVTRGLGVVLIGSNKDEEVSSSGSVLRYAQCANQANNQVICNK